MMRLSPLALGPMLAGCALIAVTACSTDESETEAGLAPSVSPAIAAVSAYDIVKVPSMTIDGNLGEWTNITAISMADNSGRTGGVDNTAKVKLAWDDTYLYAAYDVTDTELLAIQTTRDASAIYQDDAIELYIDPQGDGGAATTMTTTDYQFLANVREAVGDKKGDGVGGKDASYNAASLLARAAANGTLNAAGADVGYTVELRVGWSDLGVTPSAGHFMRIDPAVDDRDGVDPSGQSFDWAGVVGPYANPSAWKDVQLVNPPPPVSAYDIVKVPSMTIDGNLGEWTNITAVSMADNSGRTGGVDNTAKVKLAWDDTYLYAAYDVTDTELLAIQTTRDASAIYQDDAIELYIDPQGDGGAATAMATTDYQFLANVRDALRDLRGNGAGGKDGSYNAASFLARAAANGTLNAAGADVGYTVELRVGWSDLGVTPSAGHFMRIDPAVDDRDGVDPSGQSFDWAGVVGPYANPSAWKDVQLVNPPPPVSAYDIVKVSSITTDGDLSDWAGVTAISMADNSGRTGGVDNTAKVRLAWNDTYLYASYDVTDTELLAVQTTRDASAIYQDDAIELYLDPQGDGRNMTSMTPTDYQLLANVLQAVGDKKGDGSGGKDASYNATSLLAREAANGNVNAAGTDVGYTLEIQVSWSDLGVTPSGGHFMRIDPAVDDRDGAGPPPSQSFDWAGVVGPYANPSAWNDVELVVDNTAPAAPTNPSLTVVSSSQIDVSWTASTSADVAKYNIYRGTTESPALLTTVAGSPYQDTGLAPGTTYTYQIAAVDAAGNESPRTAATSATTSSPAALGIPYGASSIYSSSSSLKENTEIFTMSTDGITAPYIMNRLNAARAQGKKLMMNMTGGAHENYMTDGVFDMAKWKAAMNTYNTPEIKAAVASAVADGIIVGNSVMDEPNVSGSGDGNTWGPSGTMTKVRVDSMCAHAKNILPTVPMGVAQNHTAFEPAKSYQVCEFILSQYSNRLGTVEAFRDGGLTMAARDGHAIAFSMNILNGGFQAERAPGKTTWDADDCPLTTTGGRGTYFPNCRMTPQQVRDWGKKLGVAGCAMNMWRYDDAFMAKSENQTAFEDVATLLASTPSKECRRP